ncbi:MAG: DUF4421 family protein [Cyclobacteriaceae bacterium]|nr:DUF4421 family protein [Cyclobacteriaceae bacterium]
MCRVVILCFVALVCCEVSAQDSLRAYYIQDYPERFSLWPVLKQRSLSFAVRDRNRHLPRVNYQPNNSFLLGVGGYVFDLAVEATVAIPLNEKSKYIYGQSDVRDLQVNLLAKSFAADVYYQKYAGFYIEDKRTLIPTGFPYPQRGDIDTRNFGINGIYVFNNRKFSLRSAFNYVDQQMRSMGSFILGGTINSFKLNADSVVLTEVSRAELGEGAAFNELRNTTISITPGYSYTFIWRNFFVNGTFAIGPAHHWIRYSEAGVEQRDITINSTSYLRLGIGYNSNRYFGGIGFMAQSRTILYGDLQLVNTTSMFRMVAGYRFRKIGILKKRASDFIPKGF